MLSGSIPCRFLSTTRTVERAASPSGSQRVRRSTHPENNRTIASDPDSTRTADILAGRKSALELQFRVLSTFEANEVRRVEVLLEKMITNLEQWFATKHSRAIRPQRVVHLRLSLYRIAPLLPLMYSTAKLPVDLPSSMP